MATKLWSWMFIFVFIFGGGIALAGKGPCAVTIPSDYSAGGCGSTVNSCPPDVTTFEQSACDNTNEVDCPLDNNALQTETIFYTADVGIDCYYQDPITLAEYYWSCFTDLDQALFVYGGTAC